MFSIAPFANECFYEEFLEKQAIMFEVQIIAEYPDIEFKLYAPNAPKTGANNELLSSTMMESYGSHNIELDIPGEYRFCFSNEFSVVSV